MDVQIHTDTAGLDRHEQIRRTTPLLAHSMPMRGLFDFALRNQNKQKTSYKTVHIGIPHDVFIDDRFNRVYSFSQCFQ